jgi:chromosome partitioning protein
MAFPPKERSSPMSASFAIMNQKGGSGKTTTAVNLAAALAEKRKGVLLIDLDPQASASQWLGVKDDDKALFSILTENGNLADHVRDTPVDNLDLVASSRWLIAAERTLAGEVGSELILRRALERLPANRWDIVIIDCPPSLGLLSVSALAACQHVLIPVETHVMALAGLAALLQTMDRVRDRLNSRLTMFGILPCRVDFRKNLSRDVVERLRTRFDRQVFKTMIRENVRLAEAPSFSQPITTYDSRSVGAEDYRALAAEVLKRLKATTPKTQLVTA